MKKFLPIFAVLFGFSALAAEPSTDRRALATQWTSAPRVPAAAAIPVVQVQPVNGPSAIRIEQPVGPAAQVNNQVREQERRDQERKACLANNIGVGNTFVWASKNSNPMNYAMMVEDINVPENNVCFVKVEIKSRNSDIKVEDVQPRYFAMGSNITCGEWADEAKLEQKILAAGKGRRNVGTVLGIVGGAAVGVGAMELFGNKMIGGAVQGQKGMAGTELLRSQLAVLEKEDKSSYNRFMGYLRSLRNECESDVWQKAGVIRPAECEEIDYKALLSV